MKKIYWFLEALFYELLTKFTPIPGQIKKHNLNGHLVVTLTSFPLRFNFLHLSIKRLLSQSVTPDVLILWIADDDYSKLPLLIKEYEKTYSFFKIKKCADIKSFKKIIPALYEFPDSYIVTADDDLYYPSCWLERLTNIELSSNVLTAHRIHQVISKNGKLCSYDQWPFNVKRKDDEIYFGTSGSGILFPPNCFDKEVFNEKSFLEYCSTSDDVWLFWMSMRNNHPTVWSGYELNLVSWRGTDEDGLASINLLGNGNDICLQNMILNYGYPEMLSARLSLFDNHN